MNSININIQRKISLIVELLISISLLAQNGGAIMKKFSNQLPTSGRGDVEVSYQGKSIDQMIYEFMQEQGIPGMTLAIVQAPYIPRVVGYGLTDIKNGDLASVKTLWPIGPISQGFVAVAVMQLYEMDKLDIYSHIGVYIEDIPDIWKEATIFQLMQHSSGIADYRHINGFDPEKAYSFESLVKIVEKLPLEFKPGTEVRLSATNFLILTAIIEKVSKMSYNDFVKKNQIDLLGLKETVFGTDLSMVTQENVIPGNVHQLFKKDKNYINAPETTTGYIEKNGELVTTPSLNGAAMKGFSDIWASAENVSFWDIALAGSILISKPENRALIYAPTTLSNGKVVPAMAGWQFYNHKGLMDIKGSSPGHSSFLSRFTDASELVCVTLLANRQDVDLTNIARKIAAAFDNEKMGTGANDNNLYNYESQFSVNETMNRLEKNIKDAGIPIFAKYDHSQNAQQAGLNMLPNEVIVFGAPKVGTLLMQQNPSISIELPLRISVWQDAKGSVWVSFPQMYRMAANFGLEDNPIIEKMQSLLQALTSKSSNVY